MLKSKPKVRARSERSSEVGLFLAAASAPRSMQDGLMPRSTADQGMLTGTTMAIAYLIGAVVQDVIDGATDAVVNDRIERGVIDAKTADKKRTQYAAVASGAAMIAGLVGQRVFAQKKQESTSRSIMRTLSYWSTVTGFAGLGVAGIETATNKPTTQNKNRRPMWPLVIPAGAALALLLGLFDPAKKLATQKRTNNIQPVRAIGIGVGVSVVLASFVAAERAFAKQTDRIVKKYAPTVGSLGVPVGHIIGLGGIVFGMREAVRWAMRKAEHGGSVIEAGFSHAPSSPAVSGSAKSYVAWKTLSREGRRFVSTALTARDIQTVRKARSTKEPIRIFVGLDSAPSEADRVQLALKELERTKAYERDVIVVASPTGTGYINYVMAESVEYCSNGNSAIVALQYSKRPSPLSLDRVSYGHAQFRMLLNGIKQYLQAHPDKTPRIVVFGESLGAWTSQDAFLHQGTDGLAFLNVSAALWIGTPTQSTWKTQVLYGEKRLDTDYDSVGMFHTYDELMTLPAKKRAALRYVMLTNANDPISKFGLKLLVQAPDWLQKDAVLKTPTGVVHWRTPGTFLQTMFDMKNALKPKPGQFVSDGHDYRATLLPFVNEVYRFNVPERHLPQIEAALVQNEIARAKRIAQ